ncbi:MAG: polyketide cyclase [Chloroflexi bacterium]|nr:MAG: polyketide cyclase [Chloroflexota bacterium]
MARDNDSKSLPEDQELVITRVFDAPRELVWKALTEPDRLAQWWGPAGFEMLASRLDLRPGGVFHYSMRSSDGRVMWGKFVYRELAPPERMVFVNSFSDEEGNVLRSPFSLTWPLEVLNTISLSESGGRTTVTLRGGPINASQEEFDTFRNAQDSVRQGFAGTFDQLAAYLAAAMRGV